MRLIGKERREIQSLGGGGGLNGIGRSQGREDAESQQSCPQDRGKLPDGFHGGLQLSARLCVWGCDRASLERESWDKMAVAIRESIRAFRREGVILCFLLMTNEECLCWSLS